MVYLTRRVRFNAAHKLWVEEWSAEKNKEVFDKCSNENFHGHNYTLYVTVKGDPDPQTGMLINAKDLAKIMKEEVVERLDHKNLNLDVDLIPKGMQTTCENLAILIWKILEPKLKQCDMHCVKLEETENIYTEYFG